jgi:hypothetical protein
MACFALVVVGFAAMTLIAVIGFIPGCRTHSDKQVRRLAQVISTLGSDWYRNTSPP